MSMNRVGGITVKALGPGKTMMITATGMVTPMDMTRTATMATTVMATIMTISQPR
jgi:hypothetical protein